MVDGEKNQPRVDPVFDLSKQGAFQKGAGSEDRADAGGDYADYRRYAPGGLAGGNPYGSQWEQPGRKEVILDINLCAYVALGIYLEPCRAKILCCDLSNREIFQTELTSGEKEGSFSSFLDKLAEKFRVCWRNMELNRYRLIGAGVALPADGSEEER